MARMGIRTRRALKNRWRARNAGGGYSGGGNGDDGNGCLWIIFVIFTILIVTAAFESNNFGGFILVYGVVAGAFFIDQR